MTISEAAIATTDRAGGESGNPVISWSAKQKYTVDVWCVAGSAGDDWDPSGQDDPPGDPMQQVDGEIVGPGCGGRRSMS
jgi:hypothetical protein